MPKFKNIRIKMRGGRSRLQRVRVLASGKYRFVKNLTKRRKSSNPTGRTVKAPRRKVRRMGRRKKRRSGGKSIIRTAEKFIGVGAFLYPGLRRGHDVWKAEGDAFRAVTEGLGQYAGLYDGAFHWDVALNAWMPLIAYNGLRGLAHKLNAIIRKI